MTFNEIIHHTNEPATIITACLLLNRLSNGDFGAKTRQWSQKIAPWLHLITSWFLFRKTFQIKCYVVFTKAYNYSLHLGDYWHLQWWLLNKEPPPRFELFLRWNWMQSGCGPHRVLSSLCLVWITEFCLKVSFEFSQQKLFVFFRHEHRSKQANYFSFPLREVISSLSFL